MRNELKELIRLAHENIHIYEALQRISCSAFAGGRTNNRTHRKLAIEERSRFRHDQVTVKVLTNRRIGQVKKCHTEAGHGINCRQWRRVAGLVLPGLEV